MTKTLTLRNRETGEDGHTFNVTGMSEREFDRFWDGLVMKVDFEKWCPVYTPELGDDQTRADWLRA